MDIQEIHDSEDLRTISQQDLEELGVQASRSDGKLFMNNYC